tara:strand:+ start:24 stop:224 length:201 start_codon:yes stop_codon:yes gene_type:complete
VGSKARRSKSFCKVRKHPWISPIAKVDIIFQDNRKQSLDGSIGQMRAIYRRGDAGRAVNTYREVYF